MRICVIADQTYKSGGIERVLSLRIHQWIKKGYEVHLITNENEDRPSYFYYDEKMIHHDLDGNFNKSISLFSLSNLLLAFKYFFKLKKVLRDVQPDTIVVVNYCYEFYFIPFLRKNSYCIKEYHSSFSEESGFINKLKKYCAKFYHKHIFLSPEEGVISKQKNYTVIPNPTMNLDSEILDLNQRQMKIIAAGRIVPIKGFERLIEGWARLAPKYSDWVLEIYGDGNLSYVSQLNNLIDRYHIAENTKIYPSTNNILEKMLNSRIYVMTSISECFPMVLLEAMQTKMAILAYDCPTGPRNILKNNKTGILVEDCNIEEFCNQLENLLNSNSLAQDIANQAFIDVNQYNINIVMEKWDEILVAGKIK